jgi:hypothetical protein
MASWHPDPSFYPSPQTAGTAPAEKLAYVALTSPDPAMPDAIGALDLDLSSSSYGHVIVEVGATAVSRARESQRIIRDRYETGVVGVGDVLRAAQAHARRRAAAHDCTSRRDHGSRDARARGGSLARLTGTGTLRRVPVASRTAKGNKR